MAKKVDITPLTRVGDLLDSYPELEEVLIARAPAFKKLQNPVLRRTVARFATVEKAAAIASIPVRELVGSLRRAVGLDVRPDDETAASEPAERRTAEAPPDWVVAGNVQETIDANALLDAGVVPLTPVLKRAHELRAPDILLVVSAFRPAPLIEKLEESGFRCHVHPIDDERFETYIGCRR